MIDNKFYEEKITELTDQVREAVRSVCASAAHIERFQIEENNAEILSHLMEDIAYKAKLAESFASSIYFLTRLLKEKTKA